MTHANESTSVLIIGGGYAGLTASLFLSHHGIESILVDRHSGVSIQGRARGINPRTMEIYRSLGLEEAVVAAGKPFAEDAGGAFCSSLAEEWHWLFPPELDLANPNLTPCDYNLADQNAVEPVLIAAAAARGAVHHFNTQFDSFTEDNDGITAEVVDRGTGQRRTIRAQYMIAADGQRSPIREQLGITRSGPGIVRHAMSIVFTADLSKYVSRRAVLWFVRNDKLGTAVLTTTAVRDRWCLAVGYDPDTQTTEDFPTQRCVELVRAAVGDAALEVHVENLTPWAQGVAVSDEYHRGRVFLAGDSAHVWSPAGGIGANTGIQDAYGLAWRLAGVIRGWAKSSLLNSYWQERHPVAETLAELTEQRQAHRTGANPDDDDADDALWTFGQRYRSDAVISATHDSVFAKTLDLRAQAGTRAPHLWVEQDGERISTHDLFSRSFVVFTGADGQAWTEAAAQIAESTSIPLIGYRIGAEVELVDVDDKWRERYRVGDGGAVLIRPDGYVAWRHEGPSDSPESELRQALTTILG